MRSEPRVRERCEFLKYKLDSKEIRHEDVRKLMAHYKRALGWMLEEGHM